MSEKEEVRKIDINIPGDNNTFVDNADTVNIRQYVMASTL